MEVSATPGGPRFRMNVTYFEALVVIALWLSILMALAWIVQQRTGNSGWVDTIWTFAVGLVGVGSALWPIGDTPTNPRQWLVAVLVAIWSLRLGIHIALRSAVIEDDFRYAAFASEWGANSARRMFIFLQNQALGSVPLVFAIFIAAHVPQDSLRCSASLHINSPSSKKSATRPAFSRDWLNSSFEPSTRTLLQ